jgi:hypothetical protein
MTTTEDKAKAEAERIDSKRIAEFKFEIDSHPGGTIESYGAGVTFTEFDAVFIGRGRSQKLAAEDALEQLAASGMSADTWAHDRIQEEAEAQEEDEDEAEAMERECFAEYCKAEKIDPGKLASEDLAEVRQTFYDSLDETFELSAALYVRFGYPDDREQTLARFLDIPEDEVSATPWGDNNFEADGGEYMVLDDDEADRAAEESCESYVDDCLEIPDNVRPYFDVDRWTKDCILSDGRGHILSGYDGNEGEEIGPDGEFLFIYRTN